MDVVFTYNNWVHSGKLGHAPPESFKGSAWDETVDYVSFAWADHAIRWIEQIDHGTVLFYERLIHESAEDELKRFLKILNFQPIDPERMKCTLAHRNRSDYKRPSNGR
jgi:hypothetical protein